MADNIWLRDYLGVNTLLRTKDTGSGHSLLTCLGDATGNYFSSNSPLPVSITGSATIMATVDNVELSVNDADVNSGNPLPVSIVGASSSSVGLLLNNMALTSSNALPVSISGSSTVNGNVGLLVNSASITSSNSLPVSIVGSTNLAVTVDNVELTVNDADVTSSNPLPVSIVGASASSVGLLVNSSELTTSNSLPVSIVGSSAYNVGLLLNSASLTSSNALPVSVVGASSSNVGLLINNSSVTTSNSIPVSIVGSSGTNNVNVVTLPATPAGTNLIGKVSLQENSSDISSSNPLDVQANPKRGTATDRSGTITLGGTAQSLMSSNANRNYLYVQNNSIGDIWINFTTTAVVGQPSIRIISLNVFEMKTFVSTEAMSIIGATLGQAFTAKEG